MKNGVVETINALREIQQLLSKMTVEECMLVGEGLGVALRKDGVLRQFTLNTTEHVKSCELQAGVFELTINASFGSDAERLDLPF